MVGAASDLNVVRQRSYTNRESLDADQEGNGANKRTCISGMFDRRHAVMIGLTSEFGKLRKMSWLYQQVQ